MQDTHEKHLNNFYAACTAFTCQDFGSDGLTYNCSATDKLNNNSVETSSKISNIKEEPQYPDEDVCQDFCEDYVSVTNTVKGEVEIETPVHDTRNKMTYNYEISLYEDKTLYCALKLLLNQLSKDGEEEDPIYYICCHCDRKFLHKKFLRKHVNKCRDDPVEKLPIISSRKAFQLKNWNFRCAQCNRVFPQEASLQRHILSKSCTIKCRICGYTPRKPCELMRHMVKHTGVRISCPHCNKKFTRSYTLKKHLAMHKEFVYCCTKCVLRFESFKALRIHLRTKHEMRKSDGDSLKLCSYRRDKFYCTYCKIYFEMESNYTRHMVRHSSPDFNAKSFSCRICNKRFVKRFSLVNHSAKCVNKEAYKNTGCNIHDTNFICTVCNSYFTSTLQLRRHKSTHSGEEIKPFGCAHCEKRFTRRYSVVNHLNKCLSG